MTPEKVSSASRRFKSDMSGVGKVTFKLNSQPKKTVKGTAKDATVVKNRPVVKVVVEKLLAEKSLMELANTPLPHVQQGLTL